MKILNNMAKTELLMLIAIAALVNTTEVDDVDSKKRGVTKGSNLNTIPTGAQKPDYTYSIYSQSPNSQSSSSPSYQSQVSNSFYPSQANQYYSNTPTDPSSAYPGQPQINLVPPSSSSPFVPLNFVPTPGYQSKYQLIPSKPGGNIQFAIVPQTSNFNTQSLVPFGAQSLFAPTQHNPIGPQQNPLLASLSSQGQFNIAPSQGQFNLPLSLGNSYPGQPSATMLLLAQPNTPLYNNIFQNPTQGLFNYFPGNSQVRYGIPYSPGNSDIQAQIPQSLAKEENDISGQTSEYTAPSESSTNYKTAYATSRSSYSKL